MSFNHAYDIGFEVPHSTSEDASDVTPQMWLAALEARVKSLRENESELLAAMDSHFDTHKETLYIRRIIDQPGAVMRGESVVQYAADAKIKPEDVYEQKSDALTGKHMNSFSAVVTRIEKLHAPVHVVMLHDEMDGPALNLEISTWLKNAPLAVISNFFELTDTDIVTDSLKDFYSNHPVPVTHSWRDLHVAAIDLPAALAFARDHRDDLPADLRLASPVEAVEPDDTSPTIF